jgi:hypothetical protein
MTKRMAYIALCVGVLIAALAGTASATHYTYAISPSDLADGTAFANGQGGEPFGYDHGPTPPQGPPVGAFVAGPTGYGDSCWWSDVQGSAAGGPRDYTSFRLSPKDIFGVSDVTVGDLDSLSYWTQRGALDPLDGSYPDWRFTIYTEDTEASGGWYDHRIQFTYPNAYDNNWNQWTAGGSGTNLTVSQIRSGDGTYPTIPGTGLLTDLYTTFGSENIMFIDIIASYATASPPSDSYLDGVELSYSGGTHTASIDLMAIPEPVSMIFFGTGMAGVFGFVARRKIRKA